MADLDPGLASVLSQIMGAGGASSAPTTTTAAAGPQQGLTLSQLQQMIAGTARQSLTTAPLRGVIPSWIPAEAKGFVRSGVLDPYLGTGQDASEMRVFMGGRHNVKQKTTTAYHTKDDAGGTIYRHSTSTSHEDKTQSVAQAVNQPYLWDEDQVSSAIKRFQAAGITSVTDFDTLNRAWGSLVQRAGAMYSLSSGKRKVTPWDVLDLYKNEQIKAGTMPPDPNRTVTQVSKSVADISEGQAWSSLRGTLSNMLGRDPSDQEVRDFTYRMHSLAAHNPSITKTITQYKDGHIDGRSTHRSAGFTGADLAEQAYQKAQSDPDYAEFQAGSTYFNAALSALGAIGG